VSLKLHLLRHGQTPFSRDNMFCGAGLDPELTPDGLAMARAFAEAYRQVSWSGIFASPLRRTVATAQPICDATGIKMQLRDGLKEIHYGQWEGKDIATATYEASMLRLRPIMMTALVACLGLLPAAMSTGIGSDSQKPFAIVIVGGLVSRLLLSIFLSPVLYSVVARDNDVLKV